MSERSIDAAKRRQFFDRAPVEPGTSEQTINVDLRSVGRMLRRRILLIASCVLLFGIAGLAAALLIPPLYTASATLAVEPRQTKVTEAESVLSDLEKDNAVIASEVELMKSSVLVRSVVEKLKLTEDPAYTADPGFLLASLEKLKSILRPASEADTGEVDRATLKVAEAVRKQYSVERRGLTFVIDANFSARDPKKAAEIANTFVQEYLGSQLKAKFTATSDANDWLDQRLGELRERVRIAENAVEKYKTDNQLVDAAGQSLNQRQIEKINEQLILARSQTAATQAKVKQIEQVLNSGQEPSAFADALQSRVISDLRSRYAEFAREEAKLKTKYGDRHPSVVFVRAQLTDTRRQIKSEIGRIIAAARNDYAVAKSSEDAIQKGLEDVGNVEASSGQAGVQLRELEREAAANRTIYESFLTRFKETQEQKSFQTADSRIVSAATVPLRPSSPKRPQLLLFSLAGGLIFGIGLAALREHLENGFRTAEQLENYARATVLASIPKIGRRLKRQQVAGRKLSGNNDNLRDAGPGLTSQSDQLDHVIQHPQSPYTEAIRALRLGLRYGDSSPRHSVIMVTSCLPGEGKSTTAVNLAQYAANTGERVLLIDGDLRHPVLSQRCAPDVEHGLVDVLEGRVKLADISLRDERSDLFFLPAVGKQAPQYTAELLGSSAMRDVISRLRPDFDLVVVDSSPMLPVVDTRMLAEHVDEVVVVVEWEKTSRDALRSAFRKIPEIHRKVAGLALNNVDLKDLRNYAYYDSDAYLRNNPAYQQLAG